MTDFIISTTNIKQAYENPVFLLVSITEAFHIGKDWIAKWKNVLGGKINNYDKRILVVKDEAIEKIKKQALEVNCNAIIGLRIDVTSVPIDKTAALTVVVYGTGVKIK